MREYDVDIWTDWKKFALIVSAETDGQATSLALDYLVSIKFVKKGEHLTNIRAKLINRLETPSIQWVRGVYQGKGDGS